MSTMEIPEILAAFRINDGTYKREHVAAAVKLRDEIIPHLIRILEKLVSDPTPYLENDDYFDHVYAVILLGHFGAHQAHDVIVEAFSLPGMIPSQIFGDIVTEDLPAILFRTCGGSLDRIKSLALNKNAYDFCRASALGAMVYAVVDGIVTRAEILDFFASLFTGTEAEPDSDFWSFVADSIRDLYPEELMPVIKKAYKDELIDTWIIAPENFEEMLQRGKEYALKQIRQDMQRRMPTDVHEHMSWWACFKSEEQSSVPFDPPTAPSAAPPAAPSATLPKKKKRKRSKKKRKKKMAKASRKKKRR